MGKITDEDIRLNLIVNGDKGRAEMLKLKQTMDETSIKLREVNKEFKKLDKELPGNKSKIKELQAKQAEYNRTLADSKKKYEGLSSKIKVTKMTMAELSTYIKKTQTALRQAVPGTENWKKLNKELKTARSRFQQLSNQSKSTGGIVKSLSKLSVAVAAVIAAVAAAIRFASKAIAVIADFEQANANLATIIGKPVKELQRLTDSALQLGRTTEYTASQVTLLQTELAKLGFKEEDIMNMQKSVLHFATAVGAELPEAAALAGSVLRIFGLKAEDTEEALGALAVATNNSALNFSYLQTAMSIVGPVANSFGFSLKDTTALLGTLANAGFDASSAATASRNILLNLADANGKLATSFGGPVHSFSELMSALKKLDEQGVDLATTLELTDKRSVAAFNAFLKGVGDSEALRESLENVDGTLETISSERLNTVNGSIKLLKSAWEGFMLSMYDSKGIIKETIDFLTNSLNSVTKLLFPKVAIKEKTTEYFDEVKKIYKEKGKEAAQEYLKELSGKAGDINPIMVSLANDHMNPLSFLGRRAIRKKTEPISSAIEMSNNYIAEQEKLKEDSKNNPNVNKPNNKSTDVLLSGKEGKGTKGWSLSDDEGFLAAKAALIKRYNAGEIKDKKDFEEQLYQLEISAYKNRLANNKDDKKARLKITIEMQDKIMRHNEERLKQEKEQEKQKAVLAKEGIAVIASAERDKTKAAEAAEKIRYEAEKKKFENQKQAYENQAAVLEAIELKHQNELRRIRLSALDKELSDNEKEYKLERQKIESKYSSQILKTKSTRSWNKAVYKSEKETALAQEELKYLNELKSSLEKIKNEKKIDGIALSDEDLIKYNLQLEETKTKINELSDKLRVEGGGFFSGTGGGSLFGISQSDWEKLYANLSEGKNKAESLTTILSGIGGAAQEGFKLAAQAISLMNAKEQENFKKYKKQNEEKQDMLKKRLEVGLISEEQYNAEKEAMEQEAQAKEEEMKLRQAEREKKLAIAQAIINTSLSVMKTYTQWGFPLGIAPAAIMAGLGAAQVAMMIAQPINGAEEGGFVNTERKQDGKKFTARLSPDKRGFIDAPTVLVGENGGEYVIPNEGMRNPTLLPFINTIETARRTGKLRNLNFEAVYPISSIGKMGGGYTSAESSANYIDKEGNQNEMLPHVIVLLEKLEKRLATPLKASVSMLGRDGIIEQTEKYNEYKRRGQV